MKKRETAKSLKYVKYGGLVLILFLVSCYFVVRNNEYIQSFITNRSSKSEKKFSNNEDEAYEIFETLPFPCFVNALVPFYRDDLECPNNDNSFLHSIEANLGEIFNIWMNSLKDWFKSDEVEFSIERLRNSTSMLLYRKMLNYEIGRFVPGRIIMYFPQLGTKLLLKVCIFFFFATLTFRISSAWKVPSIKRKVVNLLNIFIGISTQILMKMEKGSPGELFFPLYLTIIIFISLLSYFHNSRMKKIVKILAVFYVIISTVSVQICKYDLDSFTIFTTMQFLYVMIVEVPLRKEERGKRIDVVLKNLGYFFFFPSNFIGPVHPISYSNFVEILVTKGNREYFYRRFKKKDWMFFGKHMLLLLLYITVFVIPKDLMILTKFASKVVLRNGMKKSKQMDSFYSFSRSRRSFKYNGILKPTETEAYPRSTYIGSIFLMAFNFRSSMYISRAVYSFLIFIITGFPYQDHLFVDINKVDFGYAARHTVRYFLFVSKV